MPGSHQVATAASVEVPCIPIDEMLDGGRCDYLKLDIEGAEGRRWRYKIDDREKAARDRHSDLSQARRHL